MIRVSVELTGESVPLAWAELEGACAAVGARCLPPPQGPSEGRKGRWAEVEVADTLTAQSLAARLALARRVIEFRGTADAAVPSWWTEAARSGARAAIRWQGHDHMAANDPIVAGLGRSWVGAGGRIDLNHPERRFWLRESASGSIDVGEELAVVDRSSLLARRLSRLPFHRPVGLDPRFARAAANLARVRAGERVVDPFVGTGALLAEAALLGARVTGVDVDPVMIRGAIRNFEHLGLAAEAWIVADAENASSETVSEPQFDVLLTDVPYGRSSGTQGEPVAALLRRVLPRWAARVRPAGRIVIVSADEPPGDALGDAWQPVRSVRVRQHRSLTRRFAVFRGRPIAGD